MAQDLYNTPRNPCHEHFIKATKSFKEGRPLRFNLQKMVRGYRKTKNLNIVELGFSFWLLHGIYRNQIPPTSSTTIFYSLSSQYRHSCKILDTRDVVYPITFFFFLAFCPKVLGGGGDLEMVLCHSVNAGWMVGTIRTGGRLSNPTSCNQVCLNFLHLKAVGC